MSLTQKTLLPKTEGLISVFHPRIWRNFKPLPLKTACPTRPLWLAYSIALHLVDSLKYQAEPESPGYLAFRSEPDFRRSVKKIMNSENRTKDDKRASACGFGYACLSFVVCVAGCWHFFDVCRWLMQPQSEKELLSGCRDHMYIYLAFLAFLFLIAVILVNVSWRLRRRVGRDVCKETISTEPNLGDHTYTSPFSVNNILTLHSLTPLDGGFPIILMNIDFIHSSLSSILLRPLLLLLLCTGTVFGQYHIYWGDVHGHSSLSDGKGSPDDYFTHARDVARLDFAILTDHDFGNGR